jgi:hypothetical protein
MPHLEPTYLRYIYDGLIKGSVHSENAAELPEGLIGLYEEAFDERQPAYKRQQLLELFAIWALLKKEVSTQFVAEVLNQPLEDILGFIATYSAWFNSPESGKYQLYHERLKVYLLQKLSEFEAHALHEKLISRLEQAIADQKADEFEWYGLEFYASHLCVSAKFHLESYQNKPIELAQSESFKTRQYLMSASFEWAYTTIDQIKAHFFSVNDIDSALQLEIQFAETYYKEKNSYLDILEFIEKEQIEIYGKRVKSLIGESKEEIEFLFYLLILSFNKIVDFSFSRLSIENQFLKLTAKILDESITKNTELFDWKILISPKHIFKIITRLKEFGLESILVSRTKLDLEKWLIENDKNNIDQNTKENFSQPNELLNLSDFDNVKNDKKRISLKIENHNKLLNNKEFEKADELFNKIKKEIQNIKKPFLKYRIGIRKGKGGGFGMFEVKDACYFYRTILLYRIQYYDIDNAIELLNFFKILEGRNYREWSAEVFRNYYYESIQHINGNEIKKAHLQLLDYLNDITNPNFFVKARDTSDYAPIICTYIKIGEYQKGIDLIQKISLDSDYSNLFWIDEGWKDSDFSRITKSLLDEKQIQYSFELLNSISIPKIKDQIRKTISFHYLQNKELIRAIKYAHELSEGKNQFFSFLSEHVDYKEQSLLIIEWLKFYPNEIYTTSISPFINPKDDDNLKFIEISEQGITNFYANIYFLLKLFEGKKINLLIFQNQIKKLIKKIPYLDSRIGYCIHTLSFMSRYKKSSQFIFLLEEVLSQKNNRDLNNDKWGNKHDINLLKKRVLNTIDYNEPFNFTMKIKCLYAIFILNLYRPYNTLNQPIGYFIESIFKSIYRMIYFSIYSIRILLIPGVVSHIIMNQKMNKINKLAIRGRLKESVDEFIKLDNDWQILNSNVGENYFTKIFKFMISSKTNVDLSNIVRYPQFCWNHDEKSKFLINYIDLSSHFVRDEIYLANLKNLADPSSISEEAVVKSTHFFKSNKNFRFSLLHKYAIQSILLNGQNTELEKIMDLNRYKNIYNSLN